MKSSAIRLLGLLLCPLLAAMTAGCSDYTYEVGDCSDSNDKGGVYVSLQMTMPSGAGKPTRATADNPTGGETGDGPEKGQDYENGITDLTAFFYEQGNGTGINATATLAAKVYFDNSLLSTPDQKGNITTRAKQVSGLERGKNYRMIIVANAGDMTQTADITTVGDAANYVFKDKPWTESTSTSNNTTTTSYSRFLMSSASGDETVSTTATSSADGSEQLPFTTDKAVNIERLAARVDYQTSNSTFTISGTTAGNTNKYQGIVTITGATLVNCLNYGTYLTKRVTADGNINGTTTLMGDETASANYVIESSTLLKSTETYNATTWAGRYDRYFKTFGDGVAENWKSLMGAGTPMTGEGQGWSRVGYTEENTMDATLQDGRFATGIVFAAKFVPTGLAGYNDGDTFFDFEGKLYRNLSGMMTTFEGNEDWNKAASDLTKMQDWGSVRTWASALKPSDPTGYRDFLLTQTAGHQATDAVTAEEAAALAWAAYMQSHHGYSENANGKPTTTSDIASATAATKLNTRRSLEPFGIRTYEGGTCYYTYWIKHSNDGDDTKLGIMERAIVRNNIYKIRITGVRSLGEDIPREDDRQLQITVAVKDWTLLQEEHIEF